MQYLFATRYLSENQQPSICCKTDRLRNAFNGALRRAIPDSGLAACLFDTPRGMKMRSSTLADFVVQALVGDCLEVGTHFETEISRDRLIRAGKGITCCRTWKQEGRMAVSVT
jgi:hypothetical protein